MLILGLLTFVINVSSRIYLKFKEFGVNFRFFYFVLYDQWFFILLLNV